MFVPKLPPVFQNILSMLQKRELNLHLDMSHDRELGI